MFDLSAILKRRERLHRVKTSAMLVAGVPLSFLGPVVLATMFWASLVLGLRFQGPDLPVGWLGLFAILSVVMIPLQYRLELRTAGAYFSQAFGESEVRGPAGYALIPGHGREMLAAGVLLANPRATSSLFVEFFLLGPRMVIGGYRQAKMARRVGLPDLAPAVAILEELRGRERGAEVASLPAVQSKEEVMPVLAFLLLHGWMGVSEDWERVWLYGESRTALRPRL